MGVRACRAILISPHTPRLRYYATRHSAYASEPDVSGFVLFALCLLLCLCLLLLLLYLISSFLDRCGMLAWRGIQTVPTLLDQEPEDELSAASDANLREFVGFAGLLRTRSMSKLKLLAMLLRYAPSVKVCQFFGPVLLNARFSVRVQPWSSV